MEIRRIGPDGAFIREFKDWQKRVQSIESKPSGKVTIRETLTTIDPETGVKTIFGELPDGSFGLEPFVGDTTPPPVTTAPTATAQPGTITVMWDGLFVDGAEQPRDFQHVNVIAHKIMGGSTVQSIVVGVIRLSTEAVIVTSDVLSYGETWEFSLESEDYNGNRADLSARSAPVAVLSLVDDSLVGEALAELTQAAEAAQDAADTAQSAAGTAQDAADEAAQSALDATNLASGKSKVHYNPVMPPLTGNTLGDMWVDIDDSYALYSWSGSAWVKTQDSQEAIDLASTKIRSFVQAGEPVGTTVGDIWMDTDNKNELFRWSGSAWVSYRDLSILDADAKAAQAIADAATAQDIADGKVATYFQSGQPTGQVATDVGDLWFDTDDGNKMWRWTGSAWVIADDQRIASTVTAAANAKTIADSKITTFYQDAEPSATGRTVGDLWVDTNDQNKLYRWSGSVWQSARDLSIASASNSAAAALEAAQAAQTAAETAQAVADGSIRTFYQSTAPTGLNNTTNVGDLWFDTDDDQAYRWSGTAWVLIQDNAIATALAAAQNAQTTADGKITSFYQPGQPATGEVGDLWFDTDDKNKPYYCSSTAPLTWTQVRDGAINDAQSTANTALTSANGKNKTYYQTGMPSGGTYILGDTWVDTDDANKLYVHNGTTFVSAQDGAIGAANSLAASKGKVIIQSGAPAVADQLAQNLWIDTTGGLNTPKRWNGSAWIAVTDKVATDAATAAATAQTKADQAFNNAATAATAAGTAQTTADGKNRTWYQDNAPTGTSHKDGDTWYDTNEGNKLYLWKTATNTWVGFQDAAISAAATAASDAATAASTAQTAAATASTAAGTAQTTADTAVTNAATADSKAAQALTDALAASNLAATKGKVLYQTTAPTGVDANPQTLWIDTTSNLNTPKRWTSGTTWVTVTDKVATDAAALASSKGKILFQTSAPTGADASALTLWIDTTSNLNTPKRWVSGTTWAAITDKVALDAAASAVTAANAASAAQGTANTAVTNAQTAQTRADQAYSQAVTAGNAAGTAQVSADGKSTVWYQTAAPAGTTHRAGDLWFDTDDGNKPYIWVTPGNLWTSARDASIATAQTKADTAFTTATAKNKTYFQPAEPTGGTYAVGDMWVDTDGGYKMSTWNGTIWQTTQDALAAKAEAILAAATDATTKATNAQTAAIAAADAAAKVKFDQVWASARSYINTTTTATGLTIKQGPTPLIVPSATAMGGDALQKTGAISGWWEDSNAKQAFDPTTLYRFSIRVRIVTPATTGGTGFYWGLVGLAANGTTYVNATGADSYSSQQWVTQNAKPATDGSWVDYVVYYKGVAASTPTGAGTVLDPRTVHASTKLFMPGMIVDYNNGNGVWEISHWSVDVVDAAGHQALVDATNKAATAKAEAIAAAATDATAKANAAQAAAIAAAAADATAKANTAKTDAMTAAATDASTKSTAAQQAAIDAAAITAQQKANAAQQAAIDAAAITAQAKADTAEADAIAAAAITAQLKADGAAQDAIDAAAITAQQKADVAQQAAIDAAAITAQQKATAAQTAAINAAAIDATAKATAAQDAALIAAAKMNAFSKNASFEEWTTSLPNGFTAFTTGPTKETSIVLTGNNAARWNLADTTTQAGLTFSTGIVGHLPNLEYYTVELEFYLVSGGLGGSGMILDWTGMTNNRAQINLATEFPTVATGKWYRLTKVLRRPTNATGTWTSMSGYLMANWSGHGAGAAKNLIFDWMNIRPSTTEEITSYGQPAAITAAQTAAATDATNKVATKSATYYETTKPTGGTYKKGDVWFDTDDGNKIYVHNGTDFVVSQDAAMFVVQPAVSTAITNAANGKNKVVYSTLDASGTGYIAGDTWFKRDGSGNIIAQWEFTTSWVSRSLDSAVIANLNAGKINAGTLSADRIGANTLSAEKLIIGSGNNLAYLGSAESATANTGYSLFTRDTVDKPEGFTASWKSTAGQATTTFMNVPPVAVKPSTKYRVNVWVKADKAGSVTYLEPLTGSTAVGHRTLPSYPFSSLAVPTVWTRWSAVFETGTAPAKTLSFRWFVNHTNGVAQDSVFSFTGFELIEMNTGELIVDGAITANSAIIANGAIGNAQIADLNADKITAGTIAAARLDAESIKAKVIEASYLQATDIFAPNSITSASGVFGIMDASVINAGTVGADRIDADIVRAKIISAPDINAVDILATGSVTSASGVFGDINASSITSGTIAAGLLDAETVKAKLIDASLINAVDILASNSITATNGIIGSLDASKITAGTLDAARIGAKSIGADKVLISSTDNMIHEADFKGNGASWDLPFGHAINQTAGRKSLPAMVVTNTTSLQTAYNSAGVPKVAIESPSSAGNAYRVTAWVKATVAIPVSGAYVAARFTLSTGGPTIINIPYVTPGTTTPATMPTAGTWYLITGVVTAPANTISVAFSINSAAAFSTGVTTWDLVTATRASNGELVVDGSITANSIAAQAVKVGNLDAAIATAGKLNATFINAKSIGVDKLVISSTDNLIVEADFGNGGTSWARDQSNNPLNGTNQIILPTGGRGGGAALRLTGTTSINYAYNVGNKIAVDDTSRFRVSMWVKTNVLYTSDKIRVGVQPYAGTVKNGNISLFKNDATVPTAEAPNPLYIPGTNTWTQITGIMLPLPVGTTHVEFYINCTSPTTAAYVDIDSIAMTRATDGTLIVDGSITAKKMEAELVLASKIIAGDPTGTYAEMSPQGFRVFADGKEADSPSTEVARLGVAGTNDYFAITKSNGDVVASINQDGLGSFAELSVSGDLTYKGEDLLTVLDRRPRGIITYGYLASGTAGPSMIGLGQVHFEAVRGRAYRVHVRATTSSYRYSGSTIIELRTAVGSTPTINSYRLHRNETLNDRNAGYWHSINFSQIWYPSGLNGTDPTWVEQVLVCAQNNTGANGSENVTLYDIEISIEDIGLQATSTMTVNNGGGTLYQAPPPPTAPPIYNHIRQFGCIDSRSYLGNGAMYNFDTGRMYQGLSPSYGNGNLSSIAIFPNMTGVLSGATINYMRVYFNFAHWYYNSGGTARIGLHRHTGVPGSFSSDGLGMTSGGWPKPGARWVDISPGYWNDFINGWWRGVTLEGDGTYGTYGYADRPTIEIGFSSTNPNPA